MRTAKRGLQNSDTTVDFADRVASECFVCGRMVNEPRKQPDLSERDEATVDLDVDSCQVCGRRLNDLSPSRYPADEGAITEQDMASPASQMTPKREAEEKNRIPGDPVKSNTQQSMKRRGAA